MRRIEWMEIMDLTVSYWNDPGMVWAGKEVGTKPGKNDSACFCAGTGS